MKWIDVNTRKIISTTDLPKDSNMSLPVIFVGGNTVAVGSMEGNVSIFKSGKSGAVQILNHNGAWYPMHVRPHLICKIRGNNSKPRKPVSLA